MVKIEINNKLYNIPTSWEDINIHTYEKLQYIDYEQDKYKILIDKIHVFTDIPKSELVKLNKNTFDFLGRTLYFLQENMEYVLVEQFKIDGVWYGLDRKLNEASYAQWIDMNNFNVSDKNLEDLSKIMSIIYRPIVKRSFSKKLDNFLRNYIYNKGKYNIEEYDGDIEERSKLFSEKLNISIAIGGIFFFIILNLIYNETSPGYMNKLKTILRMKELMKLMELKFNPPIILG